MSIRPVKRLIKSKPTRDGAGVHLRRAFGFDNTSDFDPFLLLDDFRNDVQEDYAAGFPWHPHRGIETITYVLAGTVDHGDSLGNSGSIAPGDVQWMTAGSGIIHQEMPKGDTAGRMHGFQLWANLPSSLKMTPPRYQGVEAKDIPNLTDDDGTHVRLVCGKFWGKSGPVDGVAADPIYLDVSVRPGQRKTLPVETTRHAFAYCADRTSWLGGHNSSVSSRKPLARALRSRRRNRGASRRRRRSVSFGVRKTARRTSRVVRSDRHEHAAAIAKSLPGAAGRHFPEKVTRHSAP
jgi:redox-sensitive bicupin YhaK (pirin superfamily)